MTAAASPVGRIGVADECDWGIQIERYGDQLLSPV
jgi:hypothetical protein